LNFNLLMSQQLQKLLTFSKLKKVNFTYGKLDRNKISSVLQNQGYCICRKTGIRTKEDLVEDCEEIFDTIQGQNFNVSKFLNYSQGTDARSISDENQKSVPVLGITESTSRDVFIGYHCELAYTDVLPKIVSFSCINPGVNKHKQKYPSGMTPISNQYALWKDLKNSAPKLAHNLQKYGIRYWRRYPSAEYNVDSPFKTWQDSFGYKSKTEIESIVASLGYNFTWLENDELRLDYSKPAIIYHPCVDGVETFTNSMLGYNGIYFEGHKKYGDLLDTNPKLLPLHTTLNDKNYTEFTREELHLVFSLYHKHAIAFEWNKEDVLVIDNMWYAHGRTPVYGEGRDIVALFGIPLQRDTNNPQEVHYIE
jgi:hypothetical protein